MDAIIVMNGRFGVAARWPGLHRAREMVNKFSVPRGKHMSSSPPQKVLLNLYEQKKSKVDVEGSHPSEKSGYPGHFPEPSQFWDPEPMK